MGWYTDLQAKAEKNKQNAKSTTDYLRENRAVQYAENHAKEVNTILKNVGAGMVRRNEEELKRKQEEERQKITEQLRLNDIKSKGSNDYNDKKNRDLLRNLAKSFNTTADRTKEILS